jgi:hypothetical protein
MVCCQRSQPPPFPDLVAFTDSQFATACPPPSYFLPFCAVLTESPSLSNLIDREPFYQKLTDIGKSSPANISPVCVLLSAFLATRAPSVASCEQCLRVIDAFLTPVDPDTSVDLTGLIARLLTHVYELNVCRFKQTA